MATNINNYYINSQWAALCGQVAQLIRVILDFQSSNSAGLTEAQLD
jgi:hypothetical protein